MLLGELLGGMSYAIDLAEGEQSGHTLRACLIGMSLGERAGLDEDARADLYYTLLLKDAGCSSNSARIAAVLVADDHRVKRSSKRRDLSLVTGRLKHALTTAAHDRPLGERVRTLQALATSEGLHRELIRIRCERGASIADGLGFSPATVEGIRSLDEHWDGAGHPLGLRGEEIPLLSRIAGLAQTVEICGVRTARRRGGRWFDPALVALVQEEPVPREHIALAAAVRAHAPAAAALPADEARVSRVAHAFAEVVDAKSPSTGGHSHRVAALVAGAAGELGLDAGRDTVRAALLHDIGKLGISNRILDKPAPLTRTEWAAVRAHPLQTEAVLERAGPLGAIAAIAGAHHERLDGSGYPRGLRAESLPRSARLVAVADIYDSMVSSRPYRVAMAPERAVARMGEDARAGRLDADCVDALAAFALRPGRKEGAPAV
ncbi:MAG TPA: HD domain-containing phosphohydrolase [Solirubrobacteraceae bacterium]|nr:HD domain-containing phosphohydrolase [Solirubrobacteraceae bacterium]